MAAVSRPYFQCKRMHPCMTYTDCIACVKQHRATFMYRLIVGTHHYHLQSYTHASEETSLLIHLHLCKCICMICLSLDLVCSLRLSLYLLRQCSDTLPSFRSVSQHLYSLFLHSSISTTRECMPCSVTNMQTCWYCTFVLSAGVWSRAV